MEQWTVQQARAISTLNKDILVAAGAGAGKTAVLVERIIQLLLNNQDPLDLDGLLVVTFTEAAASQMRERVRQALEEALAQNPQDTRLYKQLALLPKANISTIHAFCLGVIRRYFYHLDLDPSFRILDENEANLLQLELINDLFEKMYASNDPAFHDLVHSYGGRFDLSLQTIVLTLYAYSCSLAHPQIWLNQAAQRFIVQYKRLEELPWYPPMAKKANRILGEAKNFFQEALFLAKTPDGPAVYAQALLSDLALVDDLFKALQKGWDPFSCLIKEISHAKLPSGKKNCAQELLEECKDLRDKGKKALANLDGIYSRPAADIVQELANLVQPMELLVQMVTYFKQSYQEAKTARGVLDFTDLEHLCLQLLRKESGQPSLIAQELQETFDQVFVDEYQDINGVQEAILQLVSQGNNLFMVGDVKQSIYRFRLADHRLFLDKYHKFSTKSDTDSCRIDLSANFRSRSQILQGVNFIFRQLLTGGISELDYPLEGELVSKVAYPLGQCLGEEPVEVHILDGQAQDDEDDMQTLEAEAAFMATKISELMDQNAMIWDGKQHRPLKYGDIAILLRSTKGRIHLVQEAFQRMGIPIYAESSSGYLGSMEIQTMLALLQIIDNPHQDIPLAAVLRSPLMGLSTEELAQISLVPGNYCQGVQALGKEDTPLGRKLALFLQQLDQWRTLSRRDPLAELLWDIFRQTGYVDYVAGLPGGEQRQANLKTLYQRAIDFDHLASQGLFSFLRYLERLQKCKGDMGTPPSEIPDENVVHLMSIHKSKGLEFPLVFLADLGRKFNFQDLSGDLIFQRDLGLGPKVVHVEKGIKYPSIAHAAVGESLLVESLGEEMRVLYVALTRAKEKLILVGTSNDREKNCAKWSRSADVVGWPLPEQVLGAAKSYLDWIVPALCRHGDGRVLSSRAVPDETIAKDPASWLITLPQIPTLPPPKKLVQELVFAPVSLISLAKHRPQINNLQAKLSVSELKGRSMEEEESLRGQFLRRPQFLQDKGRDLTPTERGIAVHLVLQHLNLQTTLDHKGIALAIQTMICRELITPQQGEAVQVQPLVDFFQSPLGKRLQKGRVYREMPFSLRVQDEEIYGQNHGEWVLIQGVIDCLIEDERGLSILDFKTDHVYGPQITKRAQDYQSQIMYYKRAVEAAFQAEVAEAYLYFLSPGQIVQLF